jgi:hypothetical protein
MAVGHGLSPVSGGHWHPRHEFNQDKQHGNCKPSTLHPV